jgi:phosphoenolpyruvate carboxykinase (GTP)
MSDAPDHLIDWKGRDWTPESDDPAAHPNSRFTVSVTRCPTFDEAWDDPAGVPIDAFLFGGRRATVVPLVHEAFDWEHGVFLAATMSVETTAAASGAVGQLRFDPMAMLPFCGYNMADYFGHWLQMGKKLGAHAPKIFFVNWFRKGANGKFLWPGYGDNSRVLKYIVERIEGRDVGNRTAVGVLPKAGAIDTSGMDISQETMAELTKVDVEGWKKEAAGVEEFYKKFGDRLPKELKGELEGLRKRLG